MTAPTSLEPLRRSRRLRRNFARHVTYATRYSLRICIVRGLRSTTRALLLATALYLLRLYKRL